MDEIAKYNRERWQALADADALFTRPNLDLTPASAREFLDAEGMLGEVAGKEVLCLASGGGQQSAAFALLGANVTVYDLSEAQLERDKQAAAHYHIAIKTVQGDMRDLSALLSASFDHRISALFDWLRSRCQDCVRAGGKSAASRRNVLPCG